MTTAILIPARLASTRFPDKMLASLNGVPLVEHVYRRCKSFGYDTFVLSESKTIIDLFPAGVGILTSPDHENGTSRCMEVIDEVLNYDRYINVQGDMPDISCDIVKAVEQQLFTNADVATAYTQMDFNRRQDPNSVKLIHNRNRAHWFCRASLSYGDHHLGVYGYNRFAKQIYSVTTKYPEEDIEKLEQLRWIQNGIKIGVVEVAFTGIEINTPEDLIQWEKTNT